MRRCSRFDLDNLFPIAMVIVVLGIVLTYGLNVMGDIRDDIKSDLSASAIINESEASLTNTSTVACGFVNTNADYYVLANASGGNDNYGNWTYIAKVNMSIGESGSVTINFPGVLGNLSKINYACLSASAEYNASKNAIDGVAKIPEKLPLIVTVIIAAIIIGILTKYLMVRYS